MQPSIESYGPFAVSAAMIAWFVRSLVKGDIVFGEVYEKALAEIETLTARIESLLATQEAATARERAALEERIAAQDASIASLTFALTSITERIENGKEPEL